jgi:hypothetical protein
MRLLGVLFREIHLEILSRIYVASLSGLVADLVWFNRTY